MTNPEEIPHMRTKEGMVIEVKVDPRSSRKGVAGVIGNALRVKLTAPPVEGEANEQLREVLAEELGVRKSDVRILRGQSSRRKTVLISGLPSR